MIKYIKDPRIGYATHWPETTMGGADYTRPTTAIALGNSYFCVVDTFMPVGEREILLEELKVLIAAPSKPTSSKRAVDKDDNDELA